MIYDFIFVSNFPWLMYNTVSKASTRWLSSVDSTNSASSSSDRAAVSIRFLLAKVKFWINFMLNARTDGETMNNAIFSDCFILIFSSLRRRCVEGTSASSRTLSFQITFDWFYEQSVSSEHRRSFWNSLFGCHQSGMDCSLWYVRIYFTFYHRTVINKQLYPHQIYRIYSSRSCLSCWLIQTQ